jgi:hypothetical protein
MRFSGIGFGEINLDIFALADILDTIKAEGAECVLDGFALRILSGELICVSP